MYLRVQSKGKINLRVGSARVKATSSNLRKGDNFLLAKIKPIYLLPRLILLGADEGKIYRRLTRLVLILSNKRTVPGKSTKTGSRR